jgi:flagellar hook protein FlgE
MGVIGDNISNVNTVGYKGSRAVFSDIFSVMLNNGSTSFQVGKGTQLQSVVQNFGQGAFETTGNALDMAINGAGFFVVNNGLGNYYTRAGQFRINDVGKVQDTTGNLLQGYKFVSGVVQNSLGAIDVAGAQSKPSASTGFTLGANLNAAASAGTTFNSPITLYNSVGAENILNIQFTKQVGANSWKWVASPSVGTVTSGTSGTVSFNTAGQLSNLANNTITINYATANPPATTQTLTWSLIDATTGLTNGKLTGFAAQSNNNSFVQDGFTTGTLVGLSVDGKGVVSGLFNNGQAEKLYQVALANFLSPTGLTRSGRNLFAESIHSGQPVIGTAETGSFGSVVGSSLELSNVDLANEFVTLIQAQQAFQANARIITSSNDLLTTTVNLVR